MPRLLSMTSITMWRAAHRWCVLLIRPDRPNELQLIERNVVIRAATNCSPETAATLAESWRLADTRPKPDQAPILGRGRRRQEFLERAERTILRMTADYEHLRSMRAFEQPSEIRVRVQLAARPHDDEKHDED